MSPGAAPREDPPASAPTRPAQAWLLSRETDLLAFGGSAALSLALVAAGAALGWLDASVSTPVWLLAVLCVDVAHVWATVYRLYLDPRERARLATLAWTAPLGCYLAGVLAYANDPKLFWRGLSYLATFHFVRQQYGWVALYRRAQGEPSKGPDAWLDTAAVYAATLFPLLWWHAHLPRAFHWLAPDDYVPLVPAWLARALHPAHFALFALWAARQAQRLVRREPVSLGKCLVIASTFACWYVGIVALDSDYAFTVTNVLIHGLPYDALLWRYTRRRGAALPAGAVLARVARRGAALFALTLVLCALVEELAWDQLVWHERRALFGDAGLRLGDALLALVVPLLAVPQASHYVLDAFLWRGGARNPSLAADLGLATTSSTTAPRDAG